MPTENGILSIQALKLIVALGRIVLFWGVLAHIRQMQQSGVINCG